MGASVALAGAVLAAQATAAGAGHAAAAGGSAGPQSKLAVLERPTAHFRRSVDAYERIVRRERPRTGATPGGFAAPEQFGVSQSTLDAIAVCESGGDPTAVSSDGTYRGKYQFDYGTWASVGGSGDPAAAPEAEQDMRAAMLYARAGSSPWPICGA